MFTEEYDVFPLKYYRYISDSGKSIMCKRLNMITFEEVKIDDEEFKSNRPKSKLTLEKKTKQINIKI